MRKSYIVITILMLLNMTSCSIEKEVPKDELLNDNVKEEIINTTPIIRDVDYSDSFNTIRGGAIFYNQKDNIYEIYNPELCEEEIAPYSTFKIISTLMGLSQNIVDVDNSKLGYDGTIYSREQWNKDVELKEAFQESCLWYYEKIIDSLDKEYVQEVLNELKYGNCDISAWNEEGHNDFWLSSSLKISPMEQVEVIKKIFEGETSFEKADIELLKEFMLVEKNENYAVYGKTGSARVRNAWFTGFIEENDKKTYFAVRIDDETQELAGSVAKSIALDIISKRYNLINQ